MMFPVSADNGEISVYLDAAKIEFDVKPQIINGITMVPVRAIFEKMGADVQGEIVYVGKTGSKYHYKDYRTLKDGAFPMSLSDAEAEGRTPCKVCHK